MIIGGSKKEVLKNIKRLANAGELNAKAELTDPVFSEEESKAAIKKFYGYRKNSVRFWVSSRAAYATVDVVAAKINRQIEVLGLENLEGLKLGKRDAGFSGAIVTSNHFNPLDNLAIRKAMRRAFSKNVYIVSQETNLALPGFLGYLLNHVNILPLTKSPHYLTQEFRPRLKRLIDEGEIVLIYPEEEMWFNYRKPRPCRRGAYQFAAENNCPVIPCFVEIRELDKVDNDEFFEVKYIVHILEPIFSKAELSVRENSIEMARLDYAAKCRAYEEAYGKAVDYKFSTEDIAGWRGGRI